MSDIDKVVCFERCLGDVGIEDSRGNGYFRPSIHRFINVGVLSGTSRWSMEMVVCMLGCRWHDTFSW